MEYRRIITRYLYDKNGDRRIEWNYYFNMILPIEPTKTLKIGYDRYNEINYINDGQLEHYYVPECFVYSKLLRKGDVISVKGKQYIVIGSGNVMFRAIDDDGKIIRRNYLNKYGELTFQLDNSSLEEIEEINKELTIEAKSLIGKEKKWFDQFVDALSTGYDTEDLIPGIYKNFKIALDSKRRLYNLLSKSPNWNDDELCVEIPFEYTNEISSTVLRESVYDLFDYAFTLKIWNQSLLDIFRIVIGVVGSTANYQLSDGVYKLNRCYGMNELIDEGIISESDFNLKASRLIRKIFVNIGADKGEQFEQKFARYSDAVSSKKLKYKFVLSINPADFITMSHGNSWHSCHSVKDHGCYHAGAMSYALDDVTLISYIIPCDTTENYYSCDKIKRQLFMLDKNNNFLVQSKMYPDNNNGTLRTLFRDNVLSILNNECGLSIDNKTIDVVCMSKIYSLQYPDYSYWNYTVGNTRADCRIEIGNAAYCLSECNKIMSDHRDMTISNDNLLHRIITMDEILSIKKNAEEVKQTG